MGDYISPSGRFEIANDMVIRVSDGKILKRAELSCQCNTWIKKDGHEWAVLRVNGEGYLFLNCDTLVECKLDEASYWPDFYWYKVLSSPDGNTAAVQGCGWGGPYFVLFYDISNLPHSVEILDEHGDEVFPGLCVGCLVEIFGEGYEYEWINDDTLRVEFETKNPSPDESLPCCTVNLQRKEDGMHVIGIDALDQKNHEYLVSEYKHLIK